jgi:MFS family permease
MVARTVTLFRNSFAGLSRDIWLLSLVTLINRTGTMVIPFLTVYLTQELGFSLGEAGIVMSFFGVGSVVGTYLGGWLTDRIGYYKVQFWSLLLGGLLFISLLTVTSFWALCVAVFILSTVADAFRPATMAAIAAYSKPENRTRSFSLIRMAINLGFSGGPAIGGIIAAWYSFQGLFWIDGLTCVGAAILMLFILKEKKTTATEEEDNVEAPAKVSRSAYRDGPYIVFVIFLMIGGVVFMQLFFSWPVFLRQELAVSESVIGGLLALNGFLVFLIEMPVMYLLEKKSQPFIWICLGTLLYGLSFFFLNSPVMHLGVLIAMIVFITFGEILAMPLSNVVAINRASTARRGQYMGLYGMAFSVAHIIAPSSGLMVAEHFGFPVLWTSIFVLISIPTIGIWMLRKHL